LKKFKKFENFVPEIYAEFRTSGHFAGNYTGPYNIPICFDATNDGLMTGFNIDYLLLPC
jgi:hypothetical protein